MTLTKNRPQALPKRGGLQRPDQGFFFKWKLTQRLPVGITTPERCISSLAIGADRWRCVRISIVGIGTLLCRWKVGGACRWTQGTFHRRAPSRTRTPSTAGGCRFLLRWCNGSIRRTLGHGNLPWRRGTGVGLGRRDRVRRRRGVRSVVRFRRGSRTVRARTPTVTRWAWVDARTTLC